MRKGWRTVVLNTTFVIKMFLINWKFHCRIHVKGTVFHRIDEVFQNLEFVQSVFTGEKYGYVILEHGKIFIQKIHLVVSMSATAMDNEGNLTKVFRLIFQIRALSSTTLWDRSFNTVVSAELHRHRQIASGFYACLAMQFGSDNCSQFFCWI